MKGGAKSTSFAHMGHLLSRSSVQEREAVFTCLLLVSTN